MNTVNFLNYIQYELLEFHYYVDSDCGSVVELLLNTSDLSTIEKDFSQTFIIETDVHSFVFSNHKVSEYYLDNNNLVRVVCIK